MICGLPVYMYVLHFFVGKPEGQLMLDAIHQYTCYWMMNQLQVHEQHRITFFLLKQALKRHKQE